MRIVAGKYRGKKLKEFELSSTRPTLDRVKEAMFNLIQLKVADAVVLDLFAGTGALGCEAVSRGAMHVDFVDNNAEAIKIINFNLRNMEGSYSVNNADYLNFLKTNKKHYDIILLDPPFASGFGEVAIEHVLRNNVLYSFGCILFETAYSKPIELKFLPTDVQTKIKTLDLKTKVNFEISAHQYQISKRKYGTVAVYLIEQI